MLWYKGWLETRLKLLMSIGYLGFFMVMSHAQSLKVSGKPQSAGVESVLVTSTLFAAIFLAGAGIVTQPGLRASKGVHGSTLFTLSLPVSRFRLLAVRASLGWMEMAGAVAAFCCGLWLLNPSLHSLVAPATMLEQAGTLIACLSSVYFYSVLLATLVEDQWRIIGTAITFGVLAWLSASKYLPASVDIIHAMSKGSPVLAHSMPWSAIGFSVGLSVVLVFVALRIVQAREY
jgi:ABC-2 type transport system permease protein